MITDVDKFYAELESTGEMTVRDKLAQGAYAPKKHLLIQEWLRRKSDERLEAAALRSEAREEETLSISRNALRISEEANLISDKARRYAKWSNIIAIIAAAITIAIAIFEYKYKTP